MPTAAERQALIFLAAVAVVGGGARAASSSRFARELGVAERVAAPDTGSLGERALAAQIAAVDSARSAQSPRKGRGGGARKAGRSSKSADVPTLSGETVQPRPPLSVDVNRASAAELERLPRVGPAMAARIVAWREQHGPFRTVDDLRHVRGIGPATLALIAPAVTF